MTKFIALIPARIGSTRIKKKNIKLLKGKPLIYYSIKASLNSKLINRTIVLTDSLKIKKISEKFGAEIPFLRPKRISTKNTPMLTTVRYSLRKLNLANKSSDYIVLLPPTSPLRTGSDIDKACKMIKKNKEADCLVSTFKVKENYHPSKIMETNGKYLKRLKYKKKLSFYIRNGPAILITKLSRVNKYLIGGKVLNYIMPEKKSLDINYPEDFKKVKKLI